MHLEKDTARELARSSAGDLPVSARRSAQKVLIATTRSLVRLRGDGRSGVVDALLVHYLDDSPDGSGPLSAVAEVPGEGHGIYALTDVLEVVEESDEDLHHWRFHPDLDRPVRLSDT